MKRTAQQWIDKAASHLEVAEAARQRRDAARASNSEADIRDDLSEEMVSEILAEECFEEALDLTLMPLARNTNVGGNMIHSVEIANRLLSEHHVRTSDGPVVRYLPKTPDAAKFWKHTGVCPHCHLRVVSGGRHPECGWTAEKDGPPALPY